MFLRVYSSVITTAKGVMMKTIPEMKEITIEVDGGMVKLRQPYGSSVSFPISMWAFIQCAISDEILEPTPAEE